MTPTPNPSAPPQKGAKRRVSVKAKLMLLGGSFLVCLCVIEVGLRLVTVTSEIGTQHIRGLPAKMPLLPYRPDPEWIAVKWNERSSNPFLVRDPRLGWTPIDQDVLNDINAQGVHASRARVFAEAIPVGKTRIVAVGDSLLFGVTVKLEDVWSEVLEHRRPDLEVVNLGVPGYGTDQSFLRWRIDGKRFEADYVILGIWPDNLLRNLNLNRYHITLVEGPTEKPRFSLNDGRLTLVNSPMRGREEVIETLSGQKGRQSDHEYWISDEKLEFKPYYHVHTLRVLASFVSRLERKTMSDGVKTGKDPVGIELATAIASRFSQEVLETGATPLVVVLPELTLLGRFGREDSYPLTLMMKEAGLEVIDLMPVFAAEGAALPGGTAELFLPDKAHLSAQGNALFAHELESWLDRQGAGTAAP